MNLIIKKTIKIFLVIAFVVLPTLVAPNFASAQLPAPAGGGPTPPANNQNSSGGFGNLVILQHNYGFRTYFGHLNKIVIESGRFVKKGDLIAYTGNSGMSSGPHLHYELRFIQRAVNPFYFVKWNVQNYKDIFDKEKKIPWQSLITATAHIKVPNPTQTLPSSQLALQSKVK